VGTKPDLLAGNEGTADPTELIELIEDLAELEEAGAVADAAADARDVCIGRTRGCSRTTTKDIEGTYEGKHQAEEG
jgi:hypothetical protein